MGDTANGNWGSRELGMHITQERVHKQRDEDWILARTAAEFAFKMAEKGHNLEFTLIELAKVFDGRS